MAEATPDDIVSDDKKTTTTSASFSKLKRRIETLEKEKQELINVNEEVKSQLTNLTAEIESLRSNKDSDSDSDSSVEALEEEIYDDACEEVEREIESIASRAVELEAEAFNVHQDLVAVINENEEINAAVRKLKEEMREKEVRFERAKKQRAEAEMRVREMERKIGVLEVRESEERSKTVRIEEEMRERIDFEEGELRSLMIRIKELEKEAEVLGGSVESARVIMEGKVSVLQKEVKERCLETINAVSFRGSGGKSGANVERPVASVAMGLGATSAVVVATVAIVYFWCAKRRLWLTDGK